MKSHPHIFIIVAAFGSCVEEFPTQTQNLETLLVVDALITTVFKAHKIELSRVFAFEDEEPSPEVGAIVQVIDNQGNEFVFDETEPGAYVSQIEFSAELGKSYQMHIETADGKNYISKEVTTPNNTEVGDVTPERVFSEDGEEGGGIFLDTPANSSEPTFFRYEFDEAYKIIAPRWEPFQFQVKLNTPCIGEAFVVDITRWQDERQTCFGTSKSQRLILSSSADLKEESDTRFQLHFLSGENYVISHRYSINVIQYSQTQDAHSFYQRLGDFSSTPDIFSLTQPGFLEGNILSASDAEEMVLGYFEVASISEKRMFFNYTDLFPEEPLPPYPFNCETIGNPRLFPEGYTCFAIGDCEGQCVSPLIEQIETERVVYAGIKDGDTLAPYFTWPSPCGDCTALGTNVIPEFWIEE
ncbi:MAG: DUF4249 domain-containing protein [Croceivirga sp.]